MGTSSRARTPSEIRQLLDLTLSLAWRDVRVRYRQSLLGIGWAVAQPLALMLVFTFVFANGVTEASLPEGVPYPLFALCGLVPWTFFVGALNGCVNSLVANRNLVTKVYFPREALPLSSVVASLVDFAVASCVLFSLMAYFHVTHRWTCTLSATLLVLPLILAIQVVLTVGIGLLLAMTNLFHRDVRQVHAIAVQLLMFLSGIVLPIPSDGSRSAQLLALNPIVPLVDAYRDCLIHARAPNPAALAYSAIVSVTILACGWLSFRRASWRFAECI
jgi:ABC-type polysaccharide/polyol phosphate export permease